MRYENKTKIWSKPLSVANFFSSKTTALKNKFKVNTLCINIWMISIGMLDVSATHLSQTTQTTEKWIQILKKINE